MPPIIRRFYYTIPRTTRELQRVSWPHLLRCILYHTKNYQGTTTLHGMHSRYLYIIPYQELPGNYNQGRPRGYGVPELYHPKNYQGTTTQQRRHRPAGAIIHTKNYQGTTTAANSSSLGMRLYHTKNYQGTTTSATFSLSRLSIIPYQELPGNYNGMTGICAC